LSGQSLIISLKVMVARKSQPSSERYLSSESKTLAWILSVSRRNIRYFQQVTDPGIHDRTVTPEVGYWKL